MLLASDELQRRLKACRKPRRTSSSLLQAQFHTSSATSSQAELLASCTETQGPDTRHISVHVACSSALLKYVVGTIFVAYLLEPAFSCWAAAASNANMKMLFVRLFLAIPGLTTSSLGPGLLDTRPPCTGVCKYSNQVPATSTNFVEWEELQHDRSSRLNRTPEQFMRRPRAPSCSERNLASSALCRM